VRHLSGVTARAERHRTEMNLADRIHKNLVPQIAHSSAVIEVFGRSEASTEMGGDLIDLVEHNGAIDLYLADVSGHGVRAGVLMAMVKSAIRTRLLDPAAATLPLADAARHLNRLVAQVSEPDMFATFACIRFGPGRRVEYALAGHLPILHITTRGEVRELENQSLPLGIDPDEAFDSRTVEVQPGDVLAILTDGLVEAQSADGRQFGMERVRASLAGAADRPLAEVYSALLNAVRAHGVQSDDQTLLLARIV
jgi:serine phosphatase RsbU (regulator of sigma subunit)